MNHNKTEVGRVQCENSCISGTRLYPKSLKSMLQHCCFFIIICFGMFRDDSEKIENCPLTLLKPGACQQYEGLHCQSGAGGSKMVPDKTKHCQMIGSLPEKKQSFPSASQVVIVHGRLCFFRVIAGREKLQKHII